MTVKVPDRPDWIPLLSRLAPRQCGAFMYMGQVGAVHLYKHITTRRYLNLDTEGNCFVWDSQGDNPSNYAAVDFEEEFIRVTGSRGRNLIPRSEGFDRAKWQFQKTDAKVRGLSRSRARGRLQRG